MNFLGHSALDTGSQPGVVCNDIIPCQNDVYSLGSPSYNWKTLYAGDVTTEKVTGLLAPVDPTDATNKEYVDTRKGMAVSSATNLTSYVLNSAFPTVATAQIFGPGTANVDGLTRIDLGDKSVYKYEIVNICTMAAANTGRLNTFRLVGNGTLLATLTNIPLTADIFNQQINISGQIRVFKFFGTANTIVQSSITVLYSADSVGAVYTKSTFNTVFTVDTTPGYLDVSVFLDSVEFNALLPAQMTFYTMFSDLTPSFSL